MRSSHCQGVILRSAVGITRVCRLGSGVVAVRLTVIGKLALARRGQLKRCMDAVELRTPARAVGRG